MIKKISSICKYSNCLTPKDLFEYSSGLKLNVCKFHKKQYDLDRKNYRQQKKKCKYCEEKSNLIKKNKKILPCCEKHYSLYLIDIDQKKKKTYIASLGVDNPSKSKNIQQLKKDNCNEKWKCDHPFQSLIIKEKREQNNLKKYGYKHTLQLPNIRHKINISISKSKREKYWNIYIKKMELKKIVPLFDKEYYINNNEFKFKCLRCNKEFYSKNTKPIKIICNCTKRNSKYELEIYNWLKSIKSELNIEKNKKGLILNRKKLELDLYLPDYNLGIEFHGIIPHSELFKDKNYHQEKWKLFKEQNINVIQIFEHDWINRQDIIKSIILSKLNINQTKVYARKCEIKKIDNNIYQEFLELNHIQGSVSSKIKLGLFYNNELVSVIGISKSRFKKNEMEIIRYCTKLNTHITGGLSKFLSYIKNNYQFNNIVSYIDLRYFNGEGYIKSGFKLESISSPNYFYFKNKGNKKDHLILYSRIQFQKHKLKNKLEKFDEKLTEHENMLNNNYLRIFDAGNYKLRLIL